MRGTALFTAVALTLSLVAGPAMAGDDSRDEAKVKADQGAGQVEYGAKQIGHGVVDTAKGIGRTVSGGAVYVGHKIKHFFTGRSSDREASESVKKSTDND